MKIDVVNGGIPPKKFMFLTEKQISTSSCDQKINNLLFSEI